MQPISEPSISQGPIWQSSTRHSSVWRQNGTSLVQATAPRSKGWGELNWTTSTTTIVEVGAPVPLPVKKTKSSRRREARKRAEAAKETTIRPACFSGPSEELIFFCKEHSLPCTLPMELSELLGAFEPMHLLDLDDLDIGRLTLKSLEVKRLSKAISHLTFNSAKEGTPVQEEALKATPAAASTQSMVISVEGSFEALKATPAAASTQSMVVSVEGSLVPGSYAAMTATAQLPSADSAPKLEMTTVPVAAVTATAGMKTTHQHRFSEYLIVGDPRLQKMDESDCLYLLREVPKCHFRAHSYTSKESNRSSKLTIWGTRYVRDKKKNLPTKKASLSMTGKKENLVAERALLSDITFGVGPFKEGDTQFEGSCYVDAINRCIEVGYRFPVCPTCNEAHLESKMQAHIERIHSRRHRQSIKTSQGASAPKVSKKKQGCCVRC